MIPNIVSTDDGKLLQESNLTARQPCIMSNLTTAVWRKKD